MREAAPTGEAEEMGVEDAKWIYNAMLHDVERLREISKLQQNIISAGDFDSLGDTFEERERIVTELTVNQQHLQELMAQETQLQTSATIKVYKARFQESVQQFLHMDGVVQLLLAKQSEKLLGKMLEQQRAKNGTSEYRHIHQVTDLVARIFPGNSRRFDETK